MIHGCWPILDFVGSPTRSSNGEPTSIATSPICAGSWVCFPVRGSSICTFPHAVSSHRNHQRPLLAILAHPLASLFFPSMWRRCQVELIAFSVALALSMSFLAVEAGTTIGLGLDLKNF